MAKDWAMSLFVSICVFVINTYMFKLCMCTWNNIKIITKRQQCNNEIFKAATNEHTNKNIKHRIDIHNEIFLSLYMAPLRAAGMSTIALCHHTFAQTSTKECRSTRVSTHHIHHHTSRHISKRDFSIVATSIGCTQSDLLSMYL